MKSLLRVTAACTVLSLWVASAVPQSAPTPPSRQTAALVAGDDDTWTIPDRDHINEGTVTVITAPAGGVTVIFGSDMARVLDDDNLRVLPVVGKGPVRNVVDVLYLKAIDMGIVTADMPEFYRLQYKIPDIANRLRYIAKLYNNELHIIAPKSIHSIFDLEGKRIVAQTDVGYYAAKVVFTRLGIKATFDYRTDDARAIQKIIDGDADAYITSTGKVFPWARYVENQDRKLHLVSVPYDRRLQDLYLPSTFSADEYPNLLEPGETIDTIATSVLLVSFNWPENTDRYSRVAKFVDAFFSKIDEFYKPPRHPKWKESSISIQIPGWTRFKAAQDWLDHHNATAVIDTGQASGSITPSSQEFKQFVNQRTNRHNLSPDDVVKLYNEFVEWSRNKH